jgi:endonuclease YncB( thermonuclease family)
MNWCCRAVMKILVLVLMYSPGVWAANSKEWVRLMDCEYRDDAYNDGDSFRVRCGKEEFVVRLYFVDAPESNLRYPDRVREQSEHFGITLDETLHNGKEASAKVQETLQRPFAVWTRWASGGGQTKVPRFLGFVEVGELDLAEMLLSIGLARNKGVTAKNPRGISSKEALPRLHAMEQEARRQRRGAWATSNLATVRDSK